MSLNLAEIHGTKLAALDGDIGHVKDFYFDDHSWVIRYLIVDTGDWLAGRHVLISPHAFGLFDPYEKLLHLKLRKKQIEGSPSIESHRPVSRQYEAEYYQYYGWPVYWDAGGLWGLGGQPLMVPPPPEETQSQQQHRHRADRHLQSTESVKGYAIQATDGTIGRLRSFRVDPSSWAIRELVVETGHWYAGKEIRIAPAKVERISYEDSKVFVNLTKAEIDHTAADQLAQAEPVGRRTAGLAG